MMKNIRSLFIGLCMLMAGAVLYSCSDDDVVLSGSDVKSFAILGFEGTAQIDPYEREINLQIPSTHLSGQQLIPVFSLSDGATVTVKDDEIRSGVTLVNFSTPVTFNVRAEDGTVSAWKVKLTNNDYSIAWGLGLFISEERSNEGTRPQGWFLTQQNTGPQSNNNCGPAVTVMAANWSDASFAETIQDARNRIPYGENGEVNWNPNDVCRYLFMNQIPYVKEQLPAASLPFAELKAKFITQVKGYIDDDRIAILCLSTSYISYDPEQDLECRVGRFYSNVFYHFIVVKGYKMVDGQLYFEVNDPWNFGEQYKDGSPKGKNRYYSSDDLCKTSAYNANVVVVSLK